MGEVKTTYSFWPTMVEVQVGLEHALELQESADAATGAIGDYDL